MARLDGVRRALSSLPADRRTDLLADLACAWVEIGRAEQAEELPATITTPGGKTEAWLRMAETYRRCGRPERAHQALLHARATAPTIKGPRPRRDCLTTIAIALLNIGDTAGAGEILAALTTEPGVREGQNVPLLSRAAVACAQRGMTDQFYRIVDCLDNAGARAVVTNLAAAACDDRSMIHQASTYADSVPDRCARASLYLRMARDAVDQKAAEQARWMLTRATDTLNGPGRSDGGLSSSVTLLAEAGAIRAELGDAGAAAGLLKRARARTETLDGPYVPGLLDSLACRHAEAGYFERAIRIADRIPSSETSVRAHAFVKIVRAQIAEGQFGSAQRTTGWVDNDLTRVTLLTELAVARHRRTSQGKRL